MTKSELISAIAEKVKMSKSDVESVVNTVFSVISEELSKKSEVRLVGFGTFKTRYSAARVGKNPKTGEPIQVSASYVPVFKPGQALKDGINKDE